MTYKVNIKKSAKKEISKLDTKTKDKIKEALHFLSFNPYSEILNIKKLKSHYKLYRLRVGSFRILYEIKDEEILIVVVKVGHRKDVYKNN